MRTVKFSDKELNTMTVSEIVSRNVKTAEIFTSNGIDFCCGGNISFKEVCKKKDLEFNQLKTRILHIDTVIDETHDYDSWGLDTLVDFTVNTHHKYVIDANSLINKYADKVSKVYGKHYDVEVTEINKLFKILSLSLEAHMKKEEHILFPYIKKLARNALEGKTIQPPAFGTITNPIRMLESEHNGVGDVIMRIEQLSYNFQPPKGVCNTFRAWYEKLAEYQSNLFQHTHLENNILFPKAILLEEEIIMKYERT